jgi:hypothetical protein
VSPESCFSALCQVVTRKLQSTESTLGAPQEALSLVVHRDVMSCSFSFHKINNRDHSLAVNSRERIMCGQISWLPGGCVNNVRIVLLPPRTHRNRVIARQTAAYYPCA